MVSAIDGSGESVNSNEVLAQPKASIVEPKVAGGYKFSIALKHNGTLWSWGENTYGQLGKGSIGGYSSTPAQILGLNEIVITSYSIHYTKLYEGHSERCI